MLLRTYKLCQPSLKDTQAQDILSFPFVINPIGSSSSAFASELSFGFQVA